MKPDRKRREVFSISIPISISRRYVLRWIEENLYLAGSGSNPECSSAKGSFGGPRFLHPLYLICRYVIHKQYRKKGAARLDSPRKFF